MLVVNRHIVRVCSWISCQYMTILTTRISDLKGYFTAEKVKTFLNKIHMMSQDAKQG